MFLDDKLLKLARETELDDESIHECIGKMINTCFSSLQSGINSNVDEGIILANFKRVNKTWEIVAKKLISENRGIVKLDGFKIFVESKNEFKGIFFN